MLNNDRKRNSSWLNTDAMTPSACRYSGLPTLYGGHSLDIGHSPIFRHKRFELQHQARTAKGCSETRPEAMTESRASEIRSARRERRQDTQEPMLEVALAWR